MHLNLEYSLTKEESRLYRMIESFDHSAHGLIQELSQKFELNLNDEHPFYRLQSASNDLRRGQLNEDYSYRFHGSHVCFQNLVTGQTVDVFVNEKSEYGTFSYSNLKYYIETTDEFSDQIGNEISYDQFQSTMLSLEEKGLLIGKRFFDYIYFRLNKTTIQQRHKG